MGQIPSRHAQDRRQEFTKDIVLEEGQIRKRKKKPSRNSATSSATRRCPSRKRFPWKCKRLVIGRHGRPLAGHGRRAREAQRLGVELVVCPTPEAVRLLQDEPSETNAILHVTC